MTENKSVGNVIPNGGIAQGQVWTVAQWNVAWQSKVDASGGSAADLTLSGTLAGTPTWASGQAFPSISTTGLSALTGGGSFAGNWSGTLNLTGNLSVTGTSTLSGGTFSGGWLGSLNLGSTTGTVLNVAGETDLGSGSEAYLTIAGGTSTGGPEIQLAGAVNSSTPFTISAGGGGPLRLTGTAGVVESWSSQLQLTPPATAWSGTDGFSNTAITMSPVYTGTFAGAGQVFGAYFSADWNANVGTGSGNGAVTLGVTHDMGGSAMVGGAAGLYGRLEVASATGNTTGVGGSYVAGGFEAYSGVSDNGTSGASKGLLYGLNTVAHLGPAATYWNSLISFEADTKLESGSSVDVKLGIQIVDIGGGGAGGQDDQALSLNNNYAQGSGVGWSVGLGFGRKFGNFPIATAGTLIAVVPSTSDTTRNAAYGIDFSQATFSSGFLKSAGFLVDGSGNTTALTYKVGSNQVVGARITGWAAATGGSQAAFDATTATLAQTAAAVAEVIANLTTHGLIGA